MSWCAYLRDCLTGRAYTRDAYDAMRSTMEDLIAGQAHGFRSEIDSLLKRLEEGRQISTARAMELADARRREADLFRELAEAREDRDLFLGLAEDYAAALDAAEARLDAAHFLTDRTRP